MALVQAQTGFITKYRGVDETVVEGEIFDDSHPIVRGTPDEWWKPIAIRFAEVEQATAAPGEKRRAGVRKSSPKPSDAPDD